MICVCKLQLLLITDTKDPTHLLSMGFGFVTFYRPEEAQKALKEMQVSVIMLTFHVESTRLTE